MHNPFKDLCIFLSNAISEKIAKKKMFLGAN